METIELKFTHVTLDEFMWIRDFVRRHQRMFVADVDLSGAAGSILDVTLNSVIVLKSLSIDSETFKTLAELINYFQTTMTRP